MFRKTTDFLRGYVRVRVESAWPERILNLCAARGIELREPKWTSASELRFAVARRDFHAFRQALGNTDARWSLERKAGAPYFFARFRRRYALLAGLAACIALLIVNSLFIWDFEVSGNDTVSDEKILRVLAENGVRRGTFVHSFRSQDICNRTLPELPELSWLTVNVRGCRAYVVVRERVLPPEIVNHRSPTNIVSKRAALVTRVLALDGRAMVQKDAIVQKGQLLISGVAEISDVMQPNAPTRFLAGKGEVWGRTWHELSVKIPLTYEAKCYTGAEKHEYALLWGEKRLKFQKDSSNIGVNCDKIINQTKWQLFGTIALPVTWEEETYLPYETRSLTRTPEQAEEMGKAVLEGQLAALLGETGSVTSTQFTAKQQGQVLTVTMSAECLEQIGEEVPISMSYEKR